MLKMDKNGGGHKRLSLKNPRLEAKQKQKKYFWQCTIIYKPSCQKSSKSKMVPSMCGSTWCEMTPGLQIFPDISAGVEVHDKIKIKFDLLLHWRLNGIVCPLVYGAL